METQTGSTSRAISPLAVATVLGSGSLHKRPSSAAIKPSVHRVIPPPIQLSDSEDETPSRKKKRSNLTLGDALAELST